MMFPRMLVGEGTRQMLCAVNAETPSTFHISIHWSSAHNYQHKYACLASRVYRAAKLITQKQHYIQELARIRQDFLCQDYPDIWITNNINKLDKQHRSQATNRQQNTTQPRSVNKFR